jgi:peptidoglycan/xylan/chitin deacetylase (PgdA/CDA1 family)
MARLLVLLYHRVLKDAADIEACAEEERYYAVTAEALEEQIEAVKRTGARFVSANEISAAGGGGRRCLLTFDDSPDTHYTGALPVLKRCGVSAVFFLNAEEVGGAGRVTWAQLREMSDAGMSIQSHGWSHRFMTTIDEVELFDDLIRSRESLERGAGRPVKALALPGGRYNGRVLRAARRAGFERVFCSDVGMNRAERLPFLMKRMTVVRWMDAGYVGRVARRPAVWLRARSLRGRILSAARKVLGENFYAGVRARLKGRRVDL